MWCLYMLFPNMWDHSTPHSEGLAQNPVVIFLLWSCVFSNFFEDFHHVSERLAAGDGGVLERTSSQQAATSI